MKSRMILGVVGNVGPEADEVLQRLIRLEAIGYGASKDQDFLPMIVVKNPDITDRTLAIFEDGKSPAVGIVDSCRILESCGIYLAALPSNTSHFFRDEYQSQTPVYVIDIIALTIEAVSKLSVTKAALLATTPTIKTGLFGGRKDMSELRFVAPELDIQEKYVQSAIYGSLDASGRHDHRNADGLKSGRDDIAVDRLAFAIRSLIERDDVDVFVTGCTEVSIVVEKLRSAFPMCTFVDPMECLAKHAYSLTREIERLLEKDEHREPVKLDAVLRDSSLAAAYVAGQVRAHRRGNEL